MRAKTPKPPSVTRKLVEAATEPGAIVCDPFIGCGSIAEGIVAAGRTAVVNDMDLTLFRDWQKNHFKRLYTEF